MPLRSECRQTPFLIFIVTLLGSTLLAQTPQPGGGPDRPRIIVGDPSAPLQIYPEATAMSSPGNDVGLAAAIIKLADQRAAASKFSGINYLAKDGKTLVEGAWGFADQAKKIPNPPRTAFDIGSIGKLLTQIAALQLVEQGKLVLDEPFGKYLTDYPNRRIADQVTLRQLLLHTSGTSDIFDRITPNTDLHAMTGLKDFLPLFVDKPLEFAPGSTNHYSNAGYIVLGMVVEAAGGENYFDYVERHILNPAGMAQSGFFDRRHLPATVARSDNKSEHVTPMHPGRGSPAGGLQASAHDLARLVQAINDGRLLPPGSVNVLRGLLPHPPDPLPPADETKLASYGIEGGAPGVSAQLVVDPTGHHTRVVLGNADPPMAKDMAFTLREWMRQIPND